MFAKTLSIVCHRRKCRASQAPFVENVPLFTRCVQQQQQQQKTQGIPLIFFVPKVCRFFSLPSSCIWHSVCRNATWMDRKRECSTSQRESTLGQTGDCGYAARTLVLIGHMTNGCDEINDYSTWRFWCFFLLQR